MSGWIKIDKDLPESIRFRRIVRNLKDRNALPGVTDGDGALLISVTLGALARLWSYADTHIADDNTLDASIDEIDAIVGLPGFALSLPPNWLRVLEDGRIELPDFLERNGTSAKQRKDAARRQANFRNRQKPGPVTRDVTASNASNDARPDQTRPDLDQTRREEDMSGSSAVEPADTPRETSAAIGRVFRHWCQIHGHPRAVLDAKRRKLIAAALKTHDESTLCEAISGYRNSPFHMGENDRHTVYDDISLMLRAAKQIEAGLNFARSPPRTDLSASTRRNVAAIDDWVPPEMRNAG